MRNLWYNIKRLWNYKLPDITASEDDPPKTCDFCGSSDSTTTYTTEDFTVCHKCLCKSIANGLNNEFIQKENT